MTPIRALGFTMIGFGELRKRSMEWRIDLALVERAYAADWLLKGIFAEPPLDSLLALRGAAALRYAYSASYPIAEMPEFLLQEPTDKVVLDQALDRAAQAMATASGLAFAVDSVARGSAKVEFTGPLGRRSAAQPHIVLSFIPGKPRLDLARVPLVHPFSDDCAATVSALTVEELIGERLVLLAKNPRARDVFDLWFAATRLPQPIAWDRAHTLAKEIAASKNLPLPTSTAVFEPAYRAKLEGTWDSALRNVPAHPSFAEVERDLARVLGKQ